MSFFKQKISEELFQKKYMLHGEKDVKEVFNLVAEEVSSVESDRRWKDIFYEEMISGRLIPAGRILANARPNSPMKNFNNCYTIGIEDSMDGIADSLKEYMTILKSGGGVGFNISNLRPKEALISTGGSSSGAISFLKIFNSAGGTLHTGGGRRGASICIMNIDHPDIEEFITCKQGDKNKELTQFNISVGITEKFITAVKENKDWDLVFNNKVYKTVKAKSLYNLLCKNAFVHNEPGIFNLDIVNKYNNGFYLFDIAEVNPCLSGDTLVAVADGRNAVSIKQLAEEEKDVPVYAKDESNKTIIRMMRNPRITGYNEKILKITLDDGSEIKCTENHKFLMRDGTYKEAKDFIGGESLMPYNSYNYATNSKPRRAIENYPSESKVKLPLNKRQYSKIYEFNNGKRKKGTHIHHKNYDSSDDSIENLIELSAKEHMELHDISGDKNPYHEMSKEFKFKFASHPGESNGRYSGYTNEELLSFMISWVKKNNKPINSNIWSQLAKENGYPVYFSGMRGSLLNYFKKASILGGVNWLDNIYDRREYNRYLSLLEESDLELLFEDSHIYVKKQCEECGKELILPYGKREVGYCSSCSKKIRINKMSNTFKKNTIIKKEEYKSLIFDSFNKFVNKNNYIPTSKEIDHLISNLGFNDFRTIGYKGYRNFLNSVSDDYKINFNTHLIAKNDEYRKEKAKQLIDNGMVYNHKVISIEKYGYENVYNGTVDNVHNFGIITSYKDEKYIDSSGVFTLNCGEISMEKYSVCCLSSINLSEFIINPFEEDVSLNFKQLVKTIEIGVRFLDNVLDVTEYPLEKIKENSKKRRRIGLGFTGYADMLIKHNMKYGSTEANKLTELIAKAFRDVSYLTSCNLAIEKGVFPDYSKEYLDSDFVKNLPKQLIRKIKHNGIRNIGLNTCAPSGTISLTVGNNCSSGIEPVFSFEYDRKIRTGRGDETKTERVYDNVYLEFKEKYPNKELNDNFINVFDISVKDQIEVQSIWQKYIDHSISKTSNLPKEYTLEDYKELFLFAYKKELKGFTTFSLGGSLKGILQVKGEDIIDRRKAPKRPKELECDIHEVTIEGEKHIVLVSRLNGSLYEIFVSKYYKRFDFNNKKTGMIKKINKGRYTLFMENEVIVDNLNESFGNQNYRTLARFISMALRHGTPLQFVVDQLQKDTNFLCFDKVVARVLKKYIKEGEKVLNNEKCPSCNSDMIYIDGCKSCSNYCGFAKCE